ncbi:response regulator [Hydrogenimonas thermophila]|uniref:Response regulator receiver domain-containing protein n=1 Tax=Hydrogenimonas thermophila TaxID=223786 RepID=A0A1I5KWV9_9BACT|nr:response regulator [Hydrogenimonas thermophila]WOE69357.1 response regulator [Hydrogenimonas thermophila]WOE71867.1 response regulator [Hydrogenimonas thermophila]SFO89545.1 Response regulator receiver domain-containing protein [Hydrogenimonas thermophila]
MKIIIVEDEIYLAQSIAGKLIDFGHECDIFATVNDALNQNEHYDVVLLSTNLSGQDFYPIIKKFSDNIILLMVSYISNDTVTDPLKAGAHDYIQKPFMIEELIRKIKHYHSFKQLQKQCELYETYLKHQLGNIQLPETMNYPLPLMVQTNYQKQADAFAFALAKEMKRPLQYLPLSQAGSIQAIESLPIDAIAYMPEFQTLKKSEKEAFLNAVKGKNIITSTTENFENDELHTIELVSEHKIFDRTEILTIDDYVKFIIHNYQSKFPDTELSKKLGISRKSLWEKRKKYGIFKKK